MGRGRGLGQGKIKPALFAGVAELRGSAASDYKEKYDQGIEYLNENFAFFLTHVLNIGNPRWSSDMGETASVGFPSLGNMTEAELQNIDLSSLDVEFTFNPQFAESLTPEEIGFICAHETMHVLLNHPSQLNDYKNKQLFNVAADIVINDFLVSHGIDSYPQGACLGPEILGQDCSNMTVGEVYELVEQQGKIDDQDDQDDQEGGEGNAEGQGSGSGEDEGEIDYSQFGTPLDSHNWDETSEAEQKKLEELGEKLYEEAVDNGMEDVKENQQRDSSNIQGTKAGSGSFSGPEFKEVEGISMNWKKLLEEVDPDIFKDPSKGPPSRPSFHRRRRNMAGFKDTLLPVERVDHKDEKKNKEKPVVVMALDTSGSVQQDDVDKFITLARSIPQDRVDLRTCTFTSSFRELDIENPKYNSGGTCFSAIEQYIQKNVIRKKGEDAKDKQGRKLLKDYPKSVIVITDGYADFYGNKRPSKDQLKDSWTWLMTDSAYAYAYGGNAGPTLREPEEKKIADERTFALSDYVTLDK